MRIKYKMFVLSVAWQSQTEWSFHYGRRIFQKLVAHHISYPKKLFYELKYKGTPVEL